MLGAAGSGKTTLLKHVALTFAHRRSPTPQLRAQHNVPILLLLRECAAMIIAQSSEGSEAGQKDKETLPLSGLIAKFCKEKRDLNIPPSWFYRLLTKGRCTVMFDGLDEVANPETRKEIVAWVERQMSIHAKNRFVVTSRPHGYQNNPLAGVSILDVQPFSRGQVVDFVHKWYVDTEIKNQQRDDLGVRKDARHGADELLDRLHRNPALADLSVNPLLLTMITNVHKFRGSLPGSRVELYAEICEVALGKRQVAKGLTLDLTPAQMQRVLEPLAWRMMVEEATSLSKDDASSTITSTLTRVSPRTGPTQFLASVEKDSGILLEREAGVYTFAHLTFQEFLAACHAQRQPNLARILIQNVKKDWWWECLRLFAATGDATAIVQACVRNDPPDPKALALAIECWEESGEIDPDVRAKLERLVETGLDEIDPIKRRPVAEAKLKLRLRHMHRLDDNCSIDPDLVTHAEYQLFLDELRIKGVYRQPDHWTGTRYVADQGRKPVIGLRFSDAQAFCAWLTEREGSPWRFRPPTNDENATIDPAWETHQIVPWRLAAADGDAASQIWPVSIKERQSALIDTALEGLWHIDLDRAPELALDLDRAGTSARDRARDFARDLLDLDRASELTHDLDRAGTSARDLNRDIDSALHRAREHAHALHHALHHARAFDFRDDLHLASALFVGDLGSARKLAHDLDLNLASARADARELARDHARAGDIDLDLDRARARDLAHTLDRARALNRDLDSLLYSNFYRAGDLADTLTRALDHARELHQDIYRDRARELTRDRDFAHTLDPIHALRSARDRARDRDRDRTGDRARKLARDLLVARGEMAKIGDLLSTRDLPSDLHQFLLKYSYVICVLWFVAGARLFRGDERTFKKDSENIIFCHVLAAFKCSRIKGTYMPFEALRFVKEAQ